MQAQATQAAKLTTIKSEAPEEIIRRKIGDAKGSFTAMGNLLLVAIPMQEKIGSILLADSAIDENKWQGATGLVLQCGPGAFVDRDERKFFGQRATVGDWVFFRPADGLLLDINGQPCRLIRDSFIFGISSSHDLIK